MLFISTYPVEAADLILSSHAARASFHFPAEVSTSEDQEMCLIN